MSSREPQLPHKRVYQRWRLSGSKAGKSHLGVTRVTALAAITSVAIFLLELFRQFGLIEIAATLGTRAEVFLPPYPIGGLLEDKQEPNFTRFLAALAPAGALALCFLILRLEAGDGA